MRKRAVLMVCVAMLMASAAGGEGAGGTGGTLAHIPPSVHDYAKAVRDATLPVESVYRLGLRAADDVIQGDQISLEFLSESDFAALQDSMMGFVLWRGEGTFAVPEVGFFVKLSQARGDSVSADFFETDWRSGSYATTPPYIELQTDYSGCTKYGSLELVRCYRLWAGFKKRHPGRYVDPVDHFLADIEEELTRGTCACEGKDEALREFRTFVDEFPNASITPRVRERIQGLETGTTDIRYHCISG